MYRGFLIWWFGLLSAHVALALLPFLAHESQVTAWLPYHSYFGVAALLNGLGAPVVGEFSPGMFMAPVSKVGQGLVALFWLSVHAGLAALIVHWVRHARR